MNPCQKGGQHTGSGQQNTWSEIMSDGLGERKEDSQRSHWRWGGGSSRTRGLGWSREHVLSASCGLVAQRGPEASAPGFLSLSQAPQAPGNLHGEGKATKLRCRSQGAQGPPQHLSCRGQPRPRCSATTQSRTQSPPQPVLPGEPSMGTRLPSPLDDSQSSAQERGPPGTLTALGPGSGPLSLAGVGGTSITEGIWSGREGRTRPPVATRKFLA